MSDRECKGCEAVKLNPGYRHRLILFAPDLNWQVPGPLGQLALTGIESRQVNYVLTAEPPEIPRYGKARVICGCDAPGHANVGAGVTLLWARNGTTLEAYARDHLERFAPFVVVALHPTTSTTARSAWRTREALRSTGRGCDVVSFDGCALWADPGDSEHPWRWIRGGPLADPQDRTT